MRVVYNTAKKCLSSYQFQFEQNLNLTRYYCIGHSMIPALDPRVKSKNQLRRCPNQIR